MLSRLLQFFGWKLTDNEKPMDQEFVMVSRPLFCTALYGFGKFGRDGKDLYPKYWRRIKNGDCMIKEIEQIRKDRLKCQS